MDIIGIIKVTRRIFIFTTTKYYEGDYFRIEDGLNRLESYIGIFKGSERVATIFRVASIYDIKKLNEQEAKYYRTMKAINKEKII